MRSGYGILNPLTNLLANHLAYGYIMIGGGRMTEKEMMKISVEEFSRVQDWMEISEKDSPVYNSLKKRYIDLKVILTSSGVNLTEIDRIKA